jgi:hypothetical protein
MSRLLVHLKRSTLPVLFVLCLAALTVSYAYAEGTLHPLATQVIGDPDAAVTGKLAVGTATPGNKTLTVVGVIDFLGGGTVHNYFTQGGGNNMQINTNVDEVNTVGDATKSQWKLVLGSSLDWFSIRRSPAGGTYNEDALFFIDGSTGKVGIATVDTGNGATIPFTPQARLHVQTTSGHAVWGATTASSGSAYGVYGQSDSSTGRGVFGYATATSGPNFGVYGGTNASNGYGVFGYAVSTDGYNYGVYGASVSPSGIGTYGYASSTSGPTYGVFGESASSSGRGVTGWVTAVSGSTQGVSGQSDSSNGTGVYGLATATSGPVSGVYGDSASMSGYGVFGVAGATTGTNYGVYGVTSSSLGTGVYGHGAASSGPAYGVYGRSNSTDGRGVVGYATATNGTNLGVLGLTDSSTGYGVYYVGGLAGTGTKSAIVETRNYGWRALYAIESPQNWFEDFGQATLTAGEAVVSIEPIFAQTVNLGKAYHVFLTPRGSFCSLYVAETSPDSFTVRAVEGSNCDITFDYRIIAPRLDYEGLRLKSAEDPQTVAASVHAAPSAPATQVSHEATSPASPPPLEAP